MLVIIMLFIIMMFSDGSDISRFNRDAERLAELQKGLEVDAHWPNLSLMTASL